jgi:hypothetical protein
LAAASARFQLKQDSKKLTRLRRLIIVLDLLNLTFCNQILDEVNRILLYIGANSKLTRPYKVTDELFDLSTMAMEYFKDKIEPTLPEISYFDPDFLEYTNSYHQSI